MPDTEKDLQTLSATIECEQPQPDLYKYEHSLNRNHGETEGIAIVLEYVKSSFSSAVLCRLFDFRSAVNGVIPRKSQTLSSLSV